MPDGVHRHSQSTRSGPVTGWRVFVSFTVLTYLFSWGVWAVMAAGVFPSSLDGVLGRLGGFGPLVGAVVVVWRSDRSIRGWLTANFRVRLPLRWYGYALVLPPLLAAASGLVHATFFGGTLALDALPPLWAYPLNVLIVFFVGGGQEELGWRGFALPVAQERLSALSASLLVGAVWAVWHLPLFLVPGTAQHLLPLFPYLVAVLGISVTFTWLYNGSGGSVLLAMLLHGGINPIGAYFPTGGVDAITDPLGYGSYALVVGALALVIVGRYGADTLASRPSVTLSALVSR